MSGSGTFVRVSEGHVALNDMADQINATIAYTREFANSMKAEVSTALENLSDVVGTFTPITSSITIPTTAISGPAFPERPTFGSLGLNENWPDDFIESPNLTDYGDLDFTYIDPVAPSEIDGSFDYAEGTYASDIWTSLFNKVNNDILSGGTGFTPDVFAALVAIEKEQRRINQDAKFRQALNAVGAQGFNLASGATAGILAELYTEFSKLDQDALNNIVAKNFDLTNENRKFSVTTGLELDKLLRTTFDEAQKRSLDALKAAKQYVVSAYEANVKLYISKWEGVKAKLEALKTKVEAISSKNDGEVKIIFGKSEVLKTKVEAITAENTGKVEARKGEIDVYGTEVDAISKQYAALVEEAKLRMEGARLEIMKVIEEGKINLQAFSDKASLAKDIALGKANIAAQGMAASLGAINTSISNGYTGHESRTEGWDHNDGISEQRSFQEEA